ncbi:MAG: putative TetR family transcriptional regulator [Promethearchaeota archaeon]|nr:MAG: putative TetR family transcriptional regulator [Candidatus Lokiarchaeota archaeon]
MSAKKNSDISTMTRKERERERHRIEILTAAEKLFLEQGYDDTTMKEIARKAEFSKGTLYNYFDSKKDLYLAIGTKAYEGMIALSKEYIQKEEPGIKQLMAFGYAYYEFTKQSPAYATIFHDISIKYPDLAIKAKKDLTKVEREYIKQGQNYKTLFVGAISRAIEEKKIREDINPFLIGITLSMVSTGLIKELMHNNSLFEQLDFKADDVIDFTFHIIGEGLKPKDTNKEV